MKGAYAAPSNDSVRVCLRIRPCNEREEGLRRCITREGDVIYLDAKPSPKVFSYDRVADGDTSQEEMFVTVGKPIADSCLTGFHGTIFAYGQTGSGKTFTIQGPDGVDVPAESRGLIPRVVDYVFSVIAREERSNPNIRYFCKCSYLEIYNEKITDLLNPSVANLNILLRFSLTILRIREDIKKGVYVDGLTEEVVTTSEEAYGLLQKGAKNRHIGATLKNKMSSRSHAVFSLILESKETKGGISSLKFARLNLIDLAGSERQSDTEAAGVRLKEAGCINKSLSLLGNVIRALVDVANGKVRYVPYRDSKLTFLLKDSLGGNSKTYIIATVSPFEDAFGETLSTLKFAQRAKLILNKAVVNQDTLGSVVELQNEVKRLKEELINAASLLKQQGISSSPFGQKRMAAIVSSDDKGEGEEQRGEVQDGSLEARIQNLQKLISRALQFQEKEDKLRNDNTALQRKIETLEALSQSQERSIQELASSAKLREEEGAPKAAAHPVAALGQGSQLKKPSVLGGKDEAYSSKIPRLVKKDQLMLPSSTALSNISTRGGSCAVEEEGGGVSSKDSMWRKASALQTELLNREIMQLKEQLRNHPDVLRLSTENTDIKKELGEYKHLFANEMANYTRQYAFLQETHRVLCRELEELLKDKDAFIAILGRESASPSTPASIGDEKELREEGDNESEAVPGESVTPEREKEWEEREKALLQQVADLQRQLLAKEEKEKDSKIKMRAVITELNMSKAANKQLEIKFEAEQKAAQMLQREMEMALVESRASKEKEIKRMQDIHNREKNMWEEGFKLTETFSLEATERIKVLESNLENTRLVLTKAESEIQEKDKVARELRARLAQYEHENRRMSQCFIKNGRKGRLSFSSNGESSEQPTEKATPVSRAPRSARKKSLNSQVLDLGFKLDVQIKRYEKMKEKYQSLQEEHEILQESSRYQIDQLQSQLQQQPAVQYKTDGDSATVGGGVDVSHTEEEIKRLQADIALKDKEMEKLREELVIEREKVKEREIALEQQLKAANEREQEMEMELAREREAERDKEIQREREREEEREKEKQREIEKEQEREKTLASEREKEEEERERETQRQAIQRRVEELEQMIREMAEEEKERKLSHGIEQEQLIKQEREDRMKEREAHVQREKEWEEERNSEKERMAALEYQLKQQMTIQEQIEKEKQRESDKFNEENISLAEQLAALNEAHKDVTHRLEEKEAEWDHAIASHQNETAELQAKLSQANELINILRESIESNRAKFEETGEEQKAVLEGMLEEANVSVLAQGHEIERLKKELNEKEGELEQLRKEDEEYREEIRLLRSSHPVDDSNDSRYQVELGMRDNKIADLQRMLEDKEAEVGRMEEEIARKIKESDSAKKVELDKLASQLSLSFSEREKLLAELKRVKMSELIAFQESMHFKDKTRSLEEERLVLLREKTENEKQLQELIRQNAELVGHQNPKQKIQLHVRIKEENNELKKKLNHSQQMVRRLQQEILKLNKKLGLEEKLPIINVDEETELKMKLMQKDKENKALSSDLDLVYEQIAKLLTQCKLEAEEKKENKDNEWVDGTAEFLEGDMDIPSAGAGRGSSRKKKAEPLSDKTQKMLQKVLGALQAKDREIMDLQFQQQMNERERALRNQQQLAIPTAPTTPQPPTTTPTIPTQTTTEAAPLFLFSDEADEENLDAVEANTSFSKEGPRQATPLANVTNTFM